MKWDSIDEKIEFVYVTNNANIVPIKKAYTAWCGSKCIIAKNNPDISALFMIPALRQPERIIPLNIISSNIAGIIAETSKKSKNGIDVIEPITSEAVFGKNNVVMRAIKFATGWIKNDIRIIKKKFFMLSLFIFNSSLIFSFVVKKYRIAGQREQINGVTKSIETDIIDSFSNSIWNVYKKIEIRNGAVQR